MSNVANTLERMGFTAEIIYDEDPMNPRVDFDNCFKMACWHRRYSLGDEQPKVSSAEHRMNVIRKEFPKLEFDDLKKAWNDNYIEYPLFLYDHSGITISTNSFSCPWDSGQVGFAYISFEKAKHESGKSSKADIMEWAERMIQSEVEIYDQYLTGQVFGVTIKDRLGAEIDSCWGFFGLDTAKDEASHMLNSAIARAQGAKEEAVSIQD